GVDRLADGLGQLLKFRFLLGRRGFARHGVDSSSIARLSWAVSDIALVYKDPTNFQDAHRLDRVRAFFAGRTGPSYGMVAGDVGAPPARGTATSSQTAG